jgi:vacuolar-type H+-ATPase subunit E/Vma4
MSDFPRLARCLRTITLLSQVLEELMDGEDGEKREERCRAVLDSIALHSERAEQLSSSLEAVFDYLSGVVADQAEEGAR